jgi:hypothetical protein
MGTIYIASQMVSGVNAALLLNYESTAGDGSRRNDDSVYARTKTDVGSPNVINGSGQFKFGAYAQYTGWQYYPADAAGPLNFSIGDATLHLWLKGLSQSNSTVFHLCGSDMPAPPTFDETKAQLRMVYNSSGDKMVFQVFFTDGTSINLGGWPASTWNDGVYGTGWTHFAIVRSGTNLYAFKNGLLDGPDGSTYSIAAKTIRNPSSLIACVGGLAPNWGVSQGGGSKHFDALQFAPKAIWTAPFTPPTIAPGQIV